MGKIQVYLRDKIMKRKAKRIKDTNFSLISSNCTGAMLLHELGFRFNSPFVNLWLYPKDYLNYLENIEEYNNKELVFKYTIRTDYKYTVKYVDENNEENINKHILRIIT